ncbi:NifU family protein [Streptomyces montanisoli]|uniref:NifU family protein n=1 Tax=Streptomyces montanisoli TaxID=2798581 RepID=A0A940MCB8_9ACTN|nr:NifU family protein [Streptomyces montanisoli]MBP0457766.1 NifU family protein [Streptomyces montanisoli]
MPVQAALGAARRRETVQRVEALLAASAGDGAAARERSEELVRLVTGFYGDGLERLLYVLHEHGALSDEILTALADDDAVAGLLLAHGLHPYGVETRVEQALGAVRPYLASHGGDVELLGVTGEGAVRLRLLGGCDGCPSAPATLELAVRGVVQAAAPEVTAIDVAAPSKAPNAAGTNAAGTGPDGTGGPAAPTGTLFHRVYERGAPAGGGSSWRIVAEFAGLGPGETRHLTVGRVPVVGCRVGTGLFAFRDLCARCERPLTGTVLARHLGGAPGDAALSCPVCGAHYDVRGAGACLDEDGLHLEPLPVLSDGATVAVAVPAA